MSGKELYDRRGGVCLHLFESSSSTDAFLLKDETELVQRGKTREQNVNDQSASDDYAVAPVRSGDTLMTIAIRYGCKVAHLKQLNHMFGDQEVFGRQTIRVPIKRHGIVEELIRQELKAYETTSVDAVATNVAEVNGHDEDSDRESIGDASDRFVDVDQRRPLLRRISSSETGNSQGQQATKYLHNLDSDVREVVSAFAALRSSNDTIGASVTCRRVRPDKQTSWGLDCGVRWSTAIIIMIVIGIIVPVLFVVKYKFFHENS